MAEKANPYPSSDERLFAMLSHFSVFLGGIILPIIFWAIKKDQSQFVRFHSLQSIFFQIAYFVLIMVFVVLVMIIAIFGAGVSAMSFDSGSNAAPPVFMIILMAIFYIGLFAVIFGAIGYGVYAGIKSYQGELVMYPLIGKKVYEKVYGGH
jgi:uncharacterized protein